MKQTCFFISTLFLVKVCFLANSFAQDYVHYVTLKGNTGIPTSVVFSPDSRTLANGSSNEMVYLWDAVTGQLKTSLTAGQIGKGKYNTESVAYAPDGTTLAIGVGNGTVRLWSITSRQYKTPLIVDDGGLVAPVRYSPDGTILAVRAFTGPTGLWNSITGKLKTTLAESTPRGAGAMAYSPDGRIIVTATYEGVNLWNAKTGKLKTSLIIEEETSDHLPGFYPNASVAYSPDSTTIAMVVRDFLRKNPHKVYLWDAITGHLKTTLIGYKNEKVNGTYIEGTYTSVAYSPDGSILASGRDRPYNMVELWDTTTGHLKTTLISQHTKRRIGVTCLAYSPDGRTLAVGHDDKTIRLWRVSDPQNKNINPSIPRKSSADQVYENTIRSVMWIVTANTSEGSGVLIDKQFKLAITNAHVTGTQNTVDIYFPAPDEKGELIRDRSFYLTNSNVLKQLGYYTKGRIVARNEKTDLAIIKLDGIPETAREIDWSFTMPATNSGDIVYILGNPGGQELWRWTLGEYLNDHGDFLHIQSDVFGGNSGGPVLNKQGVLIGIIARSDRHMNALAIPVRDINRLMSESQLKHSRSSR